MSRSVRLALVLLALLLSAPPALAQSDTDAEDAGWVGTPDPADCDTDPVEAAGFMEAVRDNPQEAGEEPVFTILVADEADLPSGDPADEDDLDGAKESIWRATACLNGGDFSRFLAYFSPEGQAFFIYAIFGAFGREPGPLTEEELADFEEGLGDTLAASPTPIEETDWAVIDGYRDERELEDGQLLIMVDGTLGEEGSAYAVMSQNEDDLWQFDAFGQIGTMEDITGV